MRSRQRMPTIFSLSMLDVLCCGLGAVIFLMILYSWDARRKSRALDAESKALVAARERFESTSQDRDAKQATLTTTEQELNATRAALARVQADLERERAELIKSRATNAHLATRLQTAEQEQTDFTSRLSGAQAELRRLRRALALKTEEHSSVQTEAAALLFDLNNERMRTEATKSDLAAAKRSLLALETRLNTVDKQRSEAESIADLVPKLRTQLSAADKRIMALEADATSQKRSLLTLQGQLTLAEKLKTTLESDMALLRKENDAAATRVATTQKQLDNVKEELGTLRRQLGEEQVSAGVLRRQMAEADGRFAGIDLGGKRVVLLVDMSGSMGLSEGDKADPNKWPEVCKTVGQVLGSLPHAEKFQVILFSDGVQFPLGRAGQWQDYDRTHSPNQVRDALLEIKPDGDTNMYVGFEAAYRFKPQGLDTIYLFSDGLPNTGPGLPSPPPKDESAVANALGKHLRETMNGQWNRGGTKVRIHAVGFFYESPSLGAFLWTLTRENGGSFVGMNRP